MNKNMIQRCLHYRIRIRPIPRRFSEGVEQDVVDYVWLVENVSQDGVVKISNPNGHFAMLGSDHIREFTTDPQSETDGLKHGFFTLKGHMYFENGHLCVEPFRSP